MLYAFLRSATKGETLEVKKAIFEIESVHKFAQIAQTFLFEYMAFLSLFVPLFGISRLCWNVSMSIFSIVLFFGIPTNNDIKDRTVCYYSTGALMMPEKYLHNLKMICRVYASAVKERERENYRKPSWKLKFHNNLIMGFRFCISYRMAHRHFNSSPPQG